MPRHPITVRLSDTILDSLTYLASQRSISRQDLIEEILASATQHVASERLEKSQTFLPDSVLQLIQPRIDSLERGEEISLKRLVGKEAWCKLDDAVRRNLGKDFKELVLGGHFPGLKVGRKKSNNEQQYDKL